MSWVIMLVYLYIAYDTVKYALSVWKENNKLGSIFIMLISVTLVVLPIYVLFR